MFSSVTVDFEDRFPRRALIGDGRRQYLNVAELPVNGRKAAVLNSPLRKNFRAPEST
jgi:hypothetical protein